VTTALFVLALAGAVLALAGIVHGLRQPAARGAKADLAWLALRWFAAALFAASAAWIVVAPTADQPVLDLLEQVFPAIRAAYTSEPSKAVAAARTEQRWWIGGAFALLALALVVGKIVPPIPAGRGPGAPPADLTR